jgi:hypothetical protein
MSEQPPWNLALDVWMALGHDSREFGAYMERNPAWGDVWSNLMAAVRGPQAPCAEGVSGDDGNRCVLRDGHFGPHYGQDDVGRSEVPWRKEDRR